MSPTDCPSALAVHHLKKNVAAIIRTDCLQQDGFTGHYHVREPAGNRLDFPGVGRRFPINDFFNSQRQGCGPLEDDIRQADLTRKLPGGVNGKVNAGAAVIDVRH